MIPQHLSVTHRHIDIADSQAAKIHKAEVQAEHLPRESMQTNDLAAAGFFSPFWSIDVSRFGCEQTDHASQKTNHFSVYPYMHLQ